MVFAYAANFLIDFFPKTVFDTFPNLSELHLSLFISQISMFDFVNAGNLKKVYLTNNRLEGIRSNIFVGANDLEEIYIDKNRIHIMQNFAFSSLSELRILSLSENYLTQIGPSVFFDLPSLETLNLADNLIQEIAENALNLPNLKYLQLSGNRLVFFHHLQFASTPKLQYLWAADNKIEFVGNSLDNLHKLEVLGLNGNKLKDLKLNTLANLENLNEILLRNNDIHLNISTSDISTTKSMVSLVDLSGNRINNNGIIFEKLRLLFPNLQTIALANNSLSELDLGSIRTGGLSQLSTIYIGDNYFDQKWLEQATRNLSMDVHVSKTEGWKIVVKPVTVQ